jgi:hypothetical protein
MPYLNCASYLSIPEVPMLFIHGDADKLVHWEMMEKTYFAFPKGQKLASVLYAPIVAGLGDALLSQIVFISQQHRL